DEPDRDGERHQREIVEAVAQHIHDGESADDGERDRHAGYDPRPEMAQKDEDHHYHQSYGDQQGHLQIVHRGTDGQRAVGYDLDLDSRLNGVLEALDHGLDGVDDGNGVGARLALYQQQLRSLGAVPGADPILLDRVDHVADVGKPDRGTVAVGDNDAPIGAGVEQLVVGVERVGLLRAFEGALGLIAIGVGDGGTHVFQADALGRESDRIDLHMGRVDLLAGDDDLGDAGDRGELLRQDGAGIVVDPVDRHVIGMNG